MLVILLWEQINLFLGRLVPFKILVLRGATAAVIDEKEDSLFLLSFASVGNIRARKLIVKSIFRHSKIRFCLGPPFNPLLILFYSSCSFFSSLKLFLFYSHIYFTY